MGRGWEGVRFVSNHIYQTIMTLLLSFKSAHFTQSFLCCHCCFSDIVDNQTLGFLVLSLFWLLFIYKLPLPTVPLMISYTPWNELVPMVELYSYEVEWRIREQRPAGKSCISKVGGMNKQMDEWTHKQMDKWDYCPRECLFVQLFSCFLMKFHSFQKNLKWAKQQQPRARIGNPAAVLNSEFFLSRFPYLTPLRISETSVQALLSQRSFQISVGQIPYWGLTALCPPS